jgi:hypothetical protein
MSAEAQQGLSFSDTSGGEDGNGGSELFVQMKDEVGSADIVVCVCC